MTEPGILMAHRGHLRWLLAEAAQLGHMIMGGWFMSVRDNIWEPRRAG